MEAATRPVAGVVPPWTAGLVTSRSQIHLMSPNHPSWAPFDRMLSHLVHEFAHCVSLHVNPRIANNPRWLWESVAIYESRQAVDLRTIDYMRALSPPPFATLSGFDNTRVYDVGYSIAEFIVSRWGQRGLRDLVAANGDTAAFSASACRVRRSFCVRPRPHGLDEARTSCVHLQQKAPARALASVGCKLLRRLQPPSHPPPQR